MQNTRNAVYKKMQPEMQYTNSGNEETKPYTVLICLGYLAKDWMGEDNSLYHGMYELLNH